MMKHIPPLTLSSAVPGSHSELYVSFSPLIKSNNESGLHPLRNIVEGILETDSRPCMNEDSTTLHRLHYGRRCIATTVLQAPSVVCRSLSSCYYCAITKDWVWSDSTCFWVLCRKCRWSRKEQMFVNVISEPFGQEHKVEILLLLSYHLLRTRQTSWKRDLYRGVGTAKREGSNALWQKAFNKHL